MPLFQKRPVIITAERFYPDKLPWPAGVRRDESPTLERYYVDTLEGVHIASPGDFIITGVAGERYPCKPAIFFKTYEPAEIAFGESTEVYAALAAELGERWVP